ncbi:MAG: hypothetical protein VX498_00175 [Myxococcota bacterium]|nr:hypothetical protein [Myxococcota bacterium]
MSAAAWRPPLLEFRLDRHDRTQLELKLGYGLRPEKGKQSYRVETYIFVPRVLALTQLNYDSSRFYADTATFIRMTTPKVPLSSLSKKTAVKPWAADLKEAIDRFADGRSGDVTSAEQGLKLLACVFKGAVRDARLSTRQSLEVALAAEDTESAAGILSAFADDVRSALRRLHKIGERSEQDGVPAQLVEAWRAVDEYSSLLAEEALTDLVVQVEAAGDTAGLKGALDEVRDLAIAQYRHRRGREFGSYAVVDDRNEYLPHRWRVLKRYVSSSLYLKVARESTGVLASDIIGMFAAGAAMLFATMALLVIQARWATSLSMAFVGTMVVAYIIKDRIKELGKRHLGRRLSRGLADHVVIIRGETGRKIGTAKERFDVHDVEKLPPEVQALRYSDLESHEAIEGRPETVLAYSKDIRLSSKKLQRQFAGATGLTDVVRLNMQPLMARMDDAWEVYRYVHPQTREIYETRCARVYHINVLLRLESQGEEATLVRVRVVMDKKGIRRVEDSSSDPALGGLLEEAGPAEIRIGED